MPLKKEPSGRRSIQVEVEVPGTPDEVWQAIATGPGISSWMVPTTVEERGGKPASIQMEFGPGMVLASEVKSWDPQKKKWTAESKAFGPDAPPMASEWSIEARAGGTCVVRIVQSLFASTDDWDDQLAGTEYGWPGFLRALKLYCTHFRGQTSTNLKWMGHAAGTEAEAWEGLLAAVGLKGIGVGQRWTAPAGVPAFSGVVEYLADSPPDALLRMDKPGPGMAALGAMHMEGQSIVALGFYLYGDKAAETAARETPLWDAWMAKRFPMPGGAG